MFKYAILKYANTYYALNKFIRILISYPLDGYKYYFLN